MIQFGVSLAQPMSAGQNTMGQIGSALGQAGEASANVAKEQMAQQEAGSKQAQRTAQAATAEARAEAAQSRLNATGANLDLARERLRMQQDLGALRGNIQLQTLYQKEVADIRKNNLIADQPQRVPSFDEWLAANPRLAGQGTSPQGSTAPKPPAVGEVRQGYRFLGGDPSNPANWQKQ